VHSDEEDENDDEQQEEEEELLVQTSSLKITSTTAETLSFFQVFDENEQINESKSNHNNSLPQPILHFDDHQPQTSKHFDFFTGGLFLENLFPTSSKHCQGFFVCCFQST